MSLQVVEAEKGEARTPVAQVRHELQLMEPEFKNALPAHMPVERYMRVVMTAIQRNPDLLIADRKTLYSSCMLCAQDGLLPDGREAALVVYNTKVKQNGKDVWVKAVQYQPMIAGIRKKVRNSDEIATWDARVVFENDEFEVILGDDEKINHKPALFNPGKPIAVYSIAVLKNGERSREVMTIAEVDAIRARSKASDKGPWGTDYNEMARKTVLRRHSKALPMSTDLDDLIRRDDALYDFEGAREEAKPALPSKPRTVGAMLDHFAGAEDAQIEEGQASEPEQPEANEPGQQAEPEAKKGKTKGQKPGGLRYAPALSKNNLDALLDGLDGPMTAEEIVEFAEGALDVFERLTAEHQAELEKAVAVKWAGLFPKDAPDAPPAPRLRQGE